ncbi:MAG TPA: hypothetical protein VF365_05275 [Candidatus Limnocylindria bacterium]
MTATSIRTSSGTGRGQRVIHVVRRAALTAGWLAAGIGSRWSAFVDSGQLGPSAHQEISRRTGSRF